MNLPRRLSRPLRFAAEVGGLSEERAAQYFLDAEVAIRLESECAANQDARETFRLAVNMLVRFCPRLTVVLPSEARELWTVGEDLAADIVGTVSAVRTIASDPDWHEFDAVLNIGRERRGDLPWITINSTGWLARIAPPGTGELHCAPASPNAVGALAAACLGAGQIFLILLSRETIHAPVELSLFDHADGQPGVLDPGPELPKQPVELDALLVGCGGVSNGLGYALRRLPIVGRLDAVDRQSVREENLGPYVGAYLEHLGMPKTVCMKGLLAPKIDVVSWAEEFELFKLRLGLGLRRLPSLALAGLDNVATRHSLQRLWPGTVIDMASGGTTTQTIVKVTARDGICLLEALKRPVGDPDYAEQLAAGTGLSAERIRNSPTEPISEDDVENAPQQFRVKLKEARRRGQLICGRLTDYNLREETYSDDFAPAVPFVTAFSGIVGAAETTKHLMGFGRPLHFQFDFASSRARSLPLRCDPVCECQAQPG